MIEITNNKELAIQEKKQRYPVQCLMINDQILKSMLAIILFKPYIQINHINFIIIANH